jgi:hypothetical protein
MQRRRSSAGRIAGRPVRSYTFHPQLWRDDNAYFNRQHRQIRVEIESEP